MKTVRRRAARALAGRSFVDGDYGMAKRRGQGGRSRTTTVISQGRGRETARPCSSDADRHRVPRRCSSGIILRGPAAVRGSSAHEQLLVTGWPARHRGRTSSATPSKTDDRPRRHLHGPAGCPSRAGPALGLRTSTATCCCSTQRPACQGRHPEHPVLTVSRTDAQHPRPARARVSGVSLRASSSRGRSGGARAARREVLALAYPLILSQMSFTIQVFVDRLFLTWYSAEAVAGAVTGALRGLGGDRPCIGTGEYVTTFIAQYLGAGRPGRIGAALWQGIYFAAAAGLVIAALQPLAEPVFALAGHAEELRVHEVIYAKILLAGGFPIVLMATLASFFAGRGKTVVILVVNVLATVVNAVLDYLWIFGHGGFPRMGVARRRLRHGPVPGLRGRGLPGRDPARASTAGGTGRCRAGASSPRCSAASCASGCPPACSSRWRSWPSRSSWSSSAGSAPPPWPPAGSPST